jgi:hypothetical protein
MLCQKVGHMGNGKDDQPNCVRVLESRDPFTGQWQHEESIQAQIAVP